MESFENHKLPVLRDRDATDPARIVRWAKEALTCGQAHPKVLEKYNLLRFCVSEEVREMWAALTDDVEGAPADDYPEDINIDSTDTEELAKKRDWHVEWLQAVISYYSTSQQDSVYDAVRQHVAWTGGKDKPTLNTIAEWALSCARAEKAVAPEAWSDADPKALFAACAKVLPEAIRTLLQQNKPEGGQHTWKTAAKFLNQRTRACEADDAFRTAIEFMVPKRPKFGLFFENFSLGVFCLCPPTNWPKTGGQIWGPSAFKTRQTVGETGSVGSARSSAELPHDSLRDFEGASPAICGRRPQSGLASSLCRAQRGIMIRRMWDHQTRQM